MYDGVQEEAEGLTNWLPRFRGDFGENFKHTLTLKPLNLNKPLRKPLSKYFFIGATPAIKTFNCLLALLFSSKEASFSLLSDLELTWTASRVFDTANPYLYLSLNILLWVFIGAFQGFFPWLLFAQTCSSDTSVSITIVFSAFSDVAAFLSQYCPSHCWVVGVFSLLFLLHSHR